MKKIKSLILIGLLSITVLTSCNDESCGCSDQDLQNFAQSMNLTIDEAKEECCRLEKIADEMNSDK